MVAEYKRCRVASHSAFLWADALVGSTASSSKKVLDMLYMYSRCMAHVQHVQELDSSMTHMWKMPR